MATNKKASIPDLRLVIYNKNKEELLGHIVENRHKILNPGEKYIINNMIKNLSPHADTVVLDLGNELELQQR